MNNSGPPGPRSHSGPENPDDALSEVEALISAHFVDAKPLADDPTARMLGLVPDPTRALNRNALTALRKSADIGVEGLATRLRARGWAVSPRDVLAWERGTVPVAPALIAAIAEELRVAPDRLTRQSAAPEQVSPMVRVRESAAFQALSERLARARGSSTSTAAEALLQSPAAFAYRGHPDDAVLLAVLEHFVADVERGQHDE